MAQPSVLQQVAAAVKSRSEKLQSWWGATSETFSRLCGTEDGETFTHGEVVLANLGVVALVALCMVAEWLEGGAL